MKKRLLVGICLSVLMLGGCSSSDELKVSNKDYNVILEDMKTEMDNYGCVDSDITITTDMNPNGDFLKSEGLTSYKKVSIFSGLVSFKEDRYKLNCNVSVYKGVGQKESSTPDISINYGAICIDDKNELGFKNVEDGTSNYIYYKKDGYYNANISNSMEKEREQIKGSIGDLLNSDMVVYEKGPNYVLKGSYKLDNFLSHFGETNLFFSAIDLTILDTEGNVGDKTDKLLESGYLADKMCNVELEVSKNSKKLKKVSIFLDKDMEVSEFSIVMAIKDYNYNNDTYANDSELAVACERVAKDELREGRTLEDLRKNRDLSYICRNKVVLQDGLNYDIIELAKNGVLFEEIKSVNHFNEDYVNLEIDKIVLKQMGINEQNFKRKSE